MNPRIPRTLILFAVLGGAVAAFVTWLGSLTIGLVAGVLTWAVGLGAIGWATKQGMTAAGPGDPTRRRFLAQAGAGGLAWVAGGAAIGRMTEKLTRPDAEAVQEAAASDLGSEYMELVARAYHPDRSGDLQLLLAPFNSANYENESRSLLPRDPRSSHASVWMYLERIPLVVYGPGIVGVSDSEERVSLADLAPTTADLIGFDEWPSDREGRLLPDLRIAADAPRPKVVVTFVFDGGGWNVLDRWPDRWPHLKALMGQGANYRNAITGSFPAVTACSHATIGTGAFPRQHGITGHNIRDGSGVRKAYRSPGLADPSDILVPTLADLWHESTGAWVGEVGYQVWHMGMLGFGGRNRSSGDLPVGVYFDEDHGGGWLPHHPDLYRVPNEVPGLDVFETKRAAFADPGWDPQYAAWGNTYCCSPPIAEYQQDLLEATLRSEDIGGAEGASLLYTTFKSPDYTGHVYGMASDWTGLMVEAVDEQLGRMVRSLDERFPGEYVLIVTADHGQCPLPDSMGGVRLDPVQLGRIVEEEFGAGLGEPVLSVVPSEIYLNVDALGDAGATTADIAASLRHLTYRRTVGPYVPASAIEQDLLDEEEFAAVFSTSYLDRLGDVSRFGPGIYANGDIDPGIAPSTSS